MTIFASRSGTAKSASGGRHGQEDGLGKDEGLRFGVAEATRPDYSERPIAGANGGCGGREQEQKGAKTGMRPAIIRDAIRYATCGAAAGLSDYGTFLLLTWAFDWGPVPAQAVCRVVGGLVGFVLNRQWTFRHRIGARPVYVQFLRYGTVWGLSYILALGATAGYAWLWHGRRWPAKLCADATVAVMTFLMQRHWTFAGRGRRG